MPHQKQAGVTLIELLVTMGIVALLIGLSAVAVRVFWQHQSLNAATDEIVTQLREQQEDSVSQAFPLVFGVGFSAGRNDFTLFTYDPGSASCTAENRTLDAGAFSSSARVASTSMANDVAVAEYVSCAGLPGVVNDQIIFFHARGTSTGGSIVLEQPGLDRQTTVTVSVATGRVTKT